ncbi:Carboxylesterase 1 [Bienertia sinuspersici]
MRTLKRTKITDKSTTTLVIFLIFLLICIEILLQSQKSNPPKQPNSNPLNPFKHLHIIHNSNGTLTRIPQFFPKIPPSITNTSSPSLSKDVIINQNPNKNTRVRIFLPRNAINRPSKLPIILFVHGGGFILCSVSSPVFHHFCSKAANQLAAIVVSVEYRLAPEHRLPAAYDDVLEALIWVKESKDEWVKKYGDFSRCILMGESAGGNIVYHVGLKIADHVNDFKPLIIKGLIMIQPFFGGVDRTRSEIRLLNDEALPLVVNDLLWDLALPIGSNRSHKYCDPFSGRGSRSLGRVRDLGWRVGLAGCDGDPVFDRNVKMVKLLKWKKLNVVSMFDKGGYHDTNQTIIEEMFNNLKNSDGKTISRPPELFPTIPPSTIVDSSSPSISKDVPLNLNNSTSLRLFLPRNHSSYTNNNKKLRIIVYVHGGGFVVASVGHPPFHHFCSNAASQLAALVVSVEYRLAPEHRLPAAYDDVLEALEWVRDGKDEWITKYADLSSCVIMGDSAGANIVYNVGLRATVHVDDLKPLIIKGLILVQPYFSGLDRTESELRLVNDSILPLVANDLGWELALPVGENRGHEYSDPVKDGGSGLLDRVRDLGWQVWVVSCDGDPLYDRSVELVKLMEKRGLSVKSMFLEGGKHGMFVGDPNDTNFKATELLNFVMGFFS